ncbi:unnamed protein product [Diamesa hyperborea]
MFLKLSVLFLFVQAISGLTDWCDPLLCRLGGKHLACNHTGEFSPDCDFPVLIKLTLEEKKNIVDLHNKKRNSFAHGDIPGFQPAVRMATLRWDDTLAKLAELNVKQCKMEHDSCHNTPKFIHSGQNLGFVWYSGTPDPKPNATIASTVNFWFDEYKYANQGMLDTMSNIYGIGGNAIGHFTAMVIERNTHIGCSYATYYSMHQDYGIITNNLIACNYSSTNIISYRIYKKGPVPASECTSGVNPRYPFLCSLEENIDTNSLL